MRTPNISIHGIGVFIPEIVSIEQAIAQGRYPAEEAELHELAGAAVAGDIPAPEMALRAARSALERCGQGQTNLTSYCTPIRGIKDRTAGSRSITCSITSSAGTCSR